MRTLFKLSVGWHTILIDSIPQRDWDIAHNGWAEPRGLAPRSERVAEQDTAVRANLSPVSPTSTLFDTEVRSPSFCRFTDLTRIHSPGESDGLYCRL